MLAVSWDTVRLSLHGLAAIILVSGITAALHARAWSTAGPAVSGTLTGISALAALFLGSCWPGDVRGLSLNLTENLAQQSVWASRTTDLLSNIDCKY